MADGSPASVGNAVPDSRVYLSDLPEFDVRPVPPGWRFGKNGALGGLPGEPPRVVVRGRLYDKALSTHPPANTYGGVKYRIAPAVSFRTQVGIADSAPVPAIQGELTFEVHGDGKLLWRSEPIRQRGQIQDCRVVVEGVQVLELRVYPPPGPKPPYGGHAV